MIVQNLNTIFLECNPTDYELYLNKERFIENKEVDYLFPFLVDGYTFNNIPLAAESMLDDSYFNIHHNCFKGDYIKRMNLGLMNNRSTMKKEINALLDYDLTKVVMNTQAAQKCYIPIIAIYTKKTLNPQLETYNKLTLKIKAPNAGVYKLSDFGGYQLRGKAIKHIEAMDVCNCFMTLRTINNENNINYMPTDLLYYPTQKGDNEISFDDIEIDTDNSIFQFEKSGELELIFKY